MDSLTLIFAAGNSNCPAVCLLFKNAKHMEEGQFYNKLKLALQKQLCGFTEFWTSAAIW